MVEDLLKISKALSDETRYNIIKALINGESYACDLIGRLKKAQPTISLQLKKLEKLGIIEVKKEGRRTLILIKNDKIIKIFELFKND